MTHPWTKHELLAVANGMDDDDVLLCDAWDREHFCGYFKVDLTKAQWKHFIEFYSKFHGLPELTDEIAIFIERYGLEDQDV